MPPGTRRPARAGQRRASTGSIGAGSASRSRAWRRRCITRAERRRQRWRSTTAATSWRVGHEAASPASRASRPWCMQRAACAAACVRRVDRLDAGQRALREEAQHAGDVVGRPVGQAQRRAAPVRRAAPARLSRCVAAQRARAQPVALGERRVEAAQAGKAAGQRHLRHRQRGVGEQLLGQQQAPRGQVVDRRHAMRGEEDAAQVAVGDAQPARRSRGSCDVVAVVRRLLEHAAPPAGPARCGESTSDRPGASSGRQRRQGRKPARSALRALAKKRQFSRCGMRTRHTGRQ